VLAVILSIFRELKLRVTIRITCAGCYVYGFCVDFGYFLDYAKMSHVVRFYGGLWCGFLILGLGCMFLLR
jgi:hypothetical protein